MDDGNGDRRSWPMLPRVPVSPYRPENLRGVVFRGSTVVASGRLTPAQLRSSAWNRLFRDVYACASVRVTHEVRAVAAARLLIPKAVVSGRSAAVLWGVAAADADDDVELTLPPGSSACAVPGIRVRRWRLRPDEVQMRNRARTTSPEVTAVDLGRAARPLAESVALVDALVVGGVVDLQRIRAAAASATGPGCRRARLVADRADGLAGSPQETRLRLLMHGSRLPRPVAQFVVRDEAGFVARVDFAWPGHKVAVEYEGTWHGERQNVEKDRQRLNRLTAAGWRVVFVTAADLHHPEQLIARIAAAVAG